MPLSGSTKSRSVKCPVRQGRCKASSVPGELRNSQGVRVVLMVVGCSQYELAASSRPLCFQRCYDDSPIGLQLNLALYVSRLCCSGPPPMAASMWNRYSCIAGCSPFLSVSQCWCSCRGMGDPGGMWSLCGDYPSMGPRYELVSPL
ncbi:Hypothetical predicted protein [Pelobates cultripes]|uniref:Uncharacterized protein n=1 Tax=Pelobates cultripes TaxID=61616 RepID=A0AAD1RGG9_PELCU|nr:Hypothetical predicted protein [Pelobates cultripes]